MKQKYKMTFKCSEPECMSVFEKITSNHDLMNPRCPYCKEKKKATKFHRMGDGPVSEESINKNYEVVKSPNVIYKCESCETKIKVYQEPEQILSSCPNCDSTNLKFVCHIDKYTSQTGKIQNKAIDETANIVMQDYKMGDLTDKKLQPGEVMAPKLDPVRQSMADGMFCGAKKKQNSAIDFGTGRPTQLSGGVNMGNIARAALSGAYKDDSAMRAIQQPRARPPVSIVNKGN
jgi:DNA-directed RNA polymerase subunit RPC12/RpoP